ncbi:radical SAM-modified peptide, FtsH ternary system-associated [Streptomyces sp. B1866]|uniref:radical SAM-modified peptide, FtsH ternary system-associated n=1 Tax=Streptomyces sp. B1866 TaxID=3075431 RepID=UPI00288FB007|nr:radical SAM-modified peptide, FtsH ternary system-associated [Streptomyces sp. B1866]MDT3398739.1 radical SAM-modified peptide, FtsH ternary system-associated [Streptomyces sp. B1866]
MTERHVFTEAIPDLIDPAEYAAHPRGNLVRIRIAVTDTGVEVVGDALRPAAVEDALTALGDDGPMEQMLCG